MTFGERVRELRQARGLTQRELARRVGISFAYVSKLETGVMPPPRHNVIQSLARELGISESERDDLFGLAGKMPPDLLHRVDVETIRMLRSLENALVTSRRPTARAKGNVIVTYGPEAYRARQRSKESAGMQSEMFRALVENSLDGIVIMGPNLAVLYQNPATVGILGYKMGDLVGEDVLGLIHPDDMRKTAHRLSRLAQTPGNSDRAHLRVKHKDGTWHAIDVWAINLMNNPAVNGIVIYFRDISGSLGAEGEWAGRTALLLMAREYRLTETERKVLELIVDGLSNIKIAEQLMISPSTARFHVSNVIRKLGVANRTEAASLAVRRHLVG